MNGYVANTDYDWYRHFLDSPPIDEVNFWRPLGTTQFRALSQGEPFIFKLKQRHDHAIVGFGTYVLFVPLTVNEAWSVFGDANGAESLTGMWGRVTHYVIRNSGQPPRPVHHIGCILISTPTFFPSDSWVKAPVDWHPNIVAGKRFDLTSGDGRRFWQECLERARALQLPEVARENLVLLDEAVRFGKPTVVRPRLGQGGFRYLLRNTYRRCAVTGERSIPVLDAAHIIPYTNGGTHEMKNGVLLRADIHRLFDEGYVTITPDYRFKVGDRLDSEYHNGKIYYELSGRRIWTPASPFDQPARENLEYHSSEVFVG